MYQWCTSASTDTHIQKGLRELGTALLGFLMTWMSPDVFSLVLHVMQCNFLNVYYGCVIGSNSFDMIAVLCPQAYVYTSRRLLVFLGVVNVNISFLWDEYDKVCRQLQEQLQKYSFDHLNLALCLEGDCCTEVDN